MYYPKNLRGHSTNIRYNSKIEEMEFVDSDGSIVSHLPELSLDGKKITWSEVNLAIFDQCH